MIARAYSGLFGAADARRLALASALGWLGFGALALAIVLTAGRASGSPSTAGVALAAFSLGSALAPLRGRLVDRFGVRRALVPMAAASGAFLIALALVARGGSSGPPLVALAGLAGVTVPPLIASARVVWPVVVAPEHLQPAYGVQALLGDVGGVAGPALAGAMAALLSPSAALVACGLLPVAGALLLARLPWPAREPGARTRAGALASPGIRTLVLADAGLFGGLGALDVTLPVLAERGGSAAAAALPLAVFAGASALASLWFGTRPMQPGRRYAIAVPALVLTLAPLVAARSVFAAALVLAFAGVAFAAANVSVFELLDIVAPPGTGAEALTWLTTAGGAGSAAGAVLAGHLAATGHLTAALAVPCVFSAVAAVVVLARRATLANVGH
jgi:predicted MFS family arabinose efflux permease